MDIEDKLALDAAFILTMGAHGAYKDYAKMHNKEKRNWLDNVSTGMHTGMTIGAAGYLADKYLNKSRLRDSIVGYIVDKSASKQGESTGYLHKQAAKHKRKIDKLSLRDVNDFFRRFPKDSPIKVLGKVFDPNRKVQVAHNVNDVADILNQSRLVNVPRSVIIEKLRRGRLFPYYGSHERINSSYIFSLKHPWKGGLNISPSLLEVNGYTRKNYNRAVKDPMINLRHELAHAAAGAIYNKGTLNNYLKSLSPMTGGTIYPSRYPIEIVPPAVAMAKYINTLKGHSMSKENLNKWIDKYQTLRITDPAAYLKYRNSMPVEASRALDYLAKGTLNPSNLRAKDLITQVMLALGKKHDRYEHNLIDPSVQSIVKANPIQPSVDNNVSRKSPIKHTTALVDTDIGTSKSLPSYKINGKDITAGVMLALGGYGAYKGINKLTHADEDGEHSTSKKVLSGALAGTGTLAAAYLLDKKLNNGKVLNHLKDLFTN